MTNYYEELGLDGSLDAEGLLKELDRQENVWRSRRAKAPEKATGMLALIAEAREALATDESKARYDGSLEANAVDGPENDPASPFEVAFNQALDFWHSGQWDLAKRAIDRALSLMGSEGVDDEARAAAYWDASVIYYNNGLLEEAVEHANSFIMLEPDNPIGYGKKADSLAGLINQEESQGRDTTRLWETFDATCTTLVGKAKEQEDFNIAAYGLFLLSQSYYLHSRDYGMAAKCAYEAAELDPDFKEVHTILERLGNEYYSVDLSELLESYPFERSIYKEETLALMETLSSSGLTPDDKLGWKISDKEHYERRDLSWGRREVWRHHMIHLRRDGRLVETHKTTISSDLFRTDGGKNRTEDVTEMGDVSLEDAMRETDFSFDASLESDSRDGHVYLRSHVVGEAGPEWEKVCLHRKGPLKGKALRDLLKGIVDREAGRIEQLRRYSEELRRYSEECARINSAFDEELEPLRQGVVERYAQERSAAASEGNAKIREAESNKPARDRLSSQLSDLRSELSGLGFFAMRRKAELQEEISQLEASLSQMPSLEDVTASVQKRLDEIDRRQQAEIDMIEIKLRRKYPLPPRP